MFSCAVWTETAWGIQVPGFTTPTPKKVLDVPSDDHEKVLMNDFTMQDIKSSHQNFTIQKVKMTKAAVMEARNARLESDKKRKRTS